MNSPLKVSGIDHVVFYVKEMERAKKFYVGFLGMTVDHERPHQLFLHCGKQGIALFLSEEEIHSGSEVNHMALSLQSGKYEEVKATLEREGFEVSGHKGDPHCIYFRDPDGHRLQLLTPDEQK